MDVIQTSKIVYVITICALSWASASFYAYSSLIVLEHQRCSALYFRNFFFLFGLGFVAYAITSESMNMFTIALNNTIYLMSSYYLKLGFVTLNGATKPLKSAVQKEFLILLSVILFLNAVVFYLWFESNVMRTAVAVFLAVYYYASCLQYLKTMELDHGRNLAKHSLKVCITLVVIMLLTLIFTGNSYLYLVAVLIAQTIAISLLFGATIVIFLSDSSKLFREQANMDFLTNLYNRRYFTMRLSETYRTIKRTKDVATILLLDIDFFKKVNDTYGHDAGDLILVNVSKVLSESVRSTDMVARTGGEEFTILLPSTSLKDAQMIAEKVKTNVAQAETHYHDADIKVTVSIGIAECNEFDQADDVLKHADIALYESKTSGRNCITVYQDKSKHTEA